MNKNWKEEFKKKHSFKDKFSIIFLLTIIVSFILAFVFESIMGNYEDSNAIPNYITGLFAIVSLIFVGSIVVLILYMRDGNKVNVKKEKSQVEKKPVKTKRQAGIKKVKVLGTRTGEETGILATWNFTIYSLLVVYDNGKKEVIECKSDSKLFKDLISYMDTHKEEKSLKSSPTLTDEELETLDIIDEDK